MVLVRIEYMLALDSRNVDFFKENYLDSFVIYNSNASSLPLGRYQINLQFTSQALNYKKSYVETEAKEHQKVNTDSGEVSYHIPEIRWTKDNLSNIYMLNLTISYSTLKSSFFCIAVYLLAILLLANIILWALFIKRRKH